MASITILKDVNNIENNDYHTVKIRISNYKVKKSGDYSYVRDYQGDYLTIKGWLTDDKFTEDIQSSWNPVVGSFGGILNTVNRLLSFTGFGSIKTKAMYTLVWEDTKPVDFNLNISFNAEEDAFQEVEVPVRELQKLVVPDERSNKKFSSKELKKTLKNSEFAGTFTQKKLSETVNLVGRTKQLLFDKFLVPPSNSAISLSNIVKNEQFMAVNSIQLGEFIYLRDVVIEGVNVSWDMDTVDLRGKPMNADVSLKLKSRTVWTRSNIDSLINNRMDMDSEREIIDIGSIAGKAGDLLKSAFGLGG